MIKVHCDRCGKEIEGTTGSHSHTLSIAAAGGGAAHENMPPYVTYYCWERTAQVISIDIE